MILALIQARMNSTRLPGKVMMPLLGKPVIWRIYERLQFSKKIDKICICTSTSSNDNIIANFADENNLLCYRGSEKDLISRHLGAAKKFSANLLVRITSDDPLVDPQIIDELLELYESNNNVDFLSNAKDHSFPVGLEVEIFPITTLEKFQKNSQNEIFYEYFIRDYVFEHPNEFKIINMKSKNPTLHRWTLDYPEDYEFMQQIFLNLYESGKIFLMKDILKFLEQNPEIVKINSMHYSEFSHLKYQREISKNDF